MQRQQALNERGSPTKEPQLGDEAPRVARIDARASVVSAMGLRIMRHPREQFFITGEIRRKIGNKHLHFDTLSPFQTL